VVLERWRGFFDVRAAILRPFEDAESVKWE
jgi:hypothetical protein